MIIATAQLERLTILTPDSLIRSYPEAQVRW
jgi:PIN domain nuclease of toxin-antitoxin system